MHRILLAISSLLLLASCTEHLDYSSFRSTDNGTWGRDEIMEFTYEPSDTLQRYNVFISVRNDAQYPYNNLFLIAELNYPDGASERDTLEYAMADPEGNWLGTGYGSVKENKLWFRENIVFPSSGVYTFTVSHAMRKNGSVSGIEELPGILDVGLQIEKNQ